MGYLVNSICLVIEAALFICVPILLPAVFLITAGLVKYNERAKRVIVLILSMIYNYIVGFLGYMTFFFITVFALSDPTNKIMLYILTALVVGVLLIPLNVFAKIKGKIHIFLYSILNIGALVLGFISFINFSKLG